MSAAYHRAIGAALRAARLTPIVRGEHGVIVDTAAGPRTVRVHRYARAGTVHSSPGGRHAVAGDVWRIGIDCSAIRRPRRDEWVQSTHPPLEITCSTCELPALLVWAAEYILDQAAVCPVATDGPARTYVWTRRALADYEPSRATVAAAVGS